MTRSLPGTHIPLVCTVVRVDFDITASPASKDIDPLLVITLNDRYLK